ncbi:MAG: hypothetical protein A4E72_01538 [Syntrophus sp. PtaU1.Bin208]|nr:MAG: hypothetical protein A4E72_01538 [Syntrophus sp. PtaU1.Bin208]
MSPRLVEDDARLAVHGFHGSENGLLVFDVTDHINVGKICEDKRAGRIGNLPENGPGDVFNRHFRGLIKEMDVFARGYDDSFLSGQRLFFFPIEEVGYMNRLLRFGDLGLFEVVSSEDIAEGILDFSLGRKGHLNVQFLPVFDHGGKGQRQVRPRGKSGKSFLGETAG